MEQIISDLNYVLQFIFNIGDYESNPVRGVFLRRLVDFIVADPLIMAVIALLFAGFVVGIFIRIYHSA